MKPAQQRSAKTRPRGSAARRGRALGACCSPRGAAKAHRRPARRRRAARGARARRATPARPTASTVGTIRFGPAPSGNPADDPIAGFPTGERQRRIVCGRPGSDPSAPCSVSPTRPRSPAVDLQRALDLDFPGADCVPHAGRRRGLPERRLRRGTAAAHPPVAQTSPAVGGSAASSGPYPPGGATTAGRYPGGAPPRGATRVAARTRSSRSARTPPRWCRG